MLWEKRLNNFWNTVLILVLGVRPDLGYGKPEIL
jgi:hypothetical protein